MTVHQAVMHDRIEGLGATSFTQEASRHITGGEVRSAFAAAYAAGALAMTKAVILMIQTVPLSSNPAVCQSIAKEQIATRQTMSEGAISVMRASILMSFFQPTKGLAITSFSTSGRRITGPTWRPLFNAPGASRRR